MNIDQLNEFIKTNEGTKWLDGQKSGLIGKNTELLAEIKALNGRLIEATGRVNDATALLDTERKAVSKMAIDSTLERKLQALNANPASLKAALLTLKTENNFTVKADGDDRSAVITDSSGTETPLDQFVEAWAKSETGKGFILEINSGGGAPGSHGGDNYSQDADVQAFKSAMGLTT